MNQLDYNQLQYFGSWSVMVCCALWIAVEVFVWSRFLNGLKTWFFRAVITLLVFYAVYNGTLIVLALTQAFDWAIITVQDFNWISTQRMYSHTVIPLTLAIFMRIVNYRSHIASPEQKKIILDASRILAQSKQERERAERVEKHINEYIHQSGH